MAKKGAGQADKIPFPRKGSSATSMALLETVLDNAMDLGYKEHAESKKEIKHSGKNRSREIYAQILVFLLAVALAWVTTINVIQMRKTQGAAQELKQSLTEQVKGNYARYEVLQEEVVRLSSELAKKQSNITQQAGLSKSTLVATSATEVQGPGVVISLELNETADDGSRVDLQDTDLRSLVNALWAGGAEAISINGIRLGPHTSIRTAGSAILVDLTAIGSPYEVQAIGDAQHIMEMINSGEAGESFREAKTKSGFSVNIKREANLSLLPSTTAFYSGKENE